MGWHWWDTVLVLIGVGLIVRETSLARARLWFWLTWRITWRVEATGRTHQVPRWWYRHVLNWRLKSRGETWRYVK